MHYYPTKKIKKLLHLLIAGVAFFIILSAFKTRSINTADEEIALWEKQLNEINFIVIRISATNLINGLNLNKNQIEELRKLQKDMDTLRIHPQCSDKEDMIPEITEIRNTYNNLLSHLLTQKKLPGELKKKVYETRLNHSLMIKKTLLGHSKSQKTDLGCIKCHALPRHFPKGDIKTLKNKHVYFWQRPVIDKKHALGLLGKEGNLIIWYARKKVDAILTTSQKSIINSFNCCLIPPGELADPMRAGQAFSTDDWIKYLREIRQYDKKTWNAYKNLYIKPLEDIIIAVLPSISEYDKELALWRMEKILNETRKMDEVTFELRKEEICRRMEACYNFNDITGVSRRSKNIQLYVNAMYLLFPGNDTLYSRLANAQ
ncbi:MAG: hypothetical protein BWY70_00625 [Bacteroidetes bacterium ADurb.Bin408]|nr:MAG: hypothetical protein BWY70_00625 [Bacteroidetes bacterium ADurb.Bin408]